MQLKKTSSTKQTLGAAQWSLANRKVLGQLEIVAWSKATQRETIVLRPSPAVRPLTGGQRPKILGELRLGEVRRRHPQLLAAAAVPCRHLLADGMGAINRFTVHRTPF